MRTTPRSAELAAAAPESHPPPRARPGTAARAPPAPPCRETHTRLSPLHFEKYSSLGVGFRFHISRVAGKGGGFRFNLAYPQIN